jgi:D-glycero-D-manno-heptose 1,7-bisphosphate phosphatase
VRRAVFLDRDGVLNEAVVRDGLPFPPQRLADFRVDDEAPSGCARLKAAGFLLIVVTNQPDAARGTQSRDEVDAMHLKLRELIPTLDVIEVCWHAGEKYGDPCDCRKPRPGMLLRSATQFEIDLARSFLIGDRWRDVDCARAAGCSAVFIDRGYSEQLRSTPEITVRSFSQAVAAILHAAGAA